MTIEFNTNIVFEANGKGGVGGQQSKEANETVNNRPVLPISSEEDDGDMLNLIKDWENINPDKYFPPTPKKSE